MIAIIPRLALTSVTAPIPPSAPDPNWALVTKPLICSVRSFS